MQYAILYHHPYIFLLYSVHLGSGSRGSEPLESPRPSPSPHPNATPSPRPPVPKRAHTDGGTLCSSTPLHSPTHSLTLFLIISLVLFSFSPRSQRSQGPQTLQI